MVFTMKDGIFMGYVSFREGKCRKPIWQRNIKAPSGRRRSITAPSFAPASNSTRPKTPMCLSWYQWIDFGSGMMCFPTIWGQRLSESWKSGSVALKQWEVGNICNKVLGIYSHATKTMIADYNTDIYIYVNIYTYAVESQYGTPIFSLYETT